MHILVGLVDWNAGMFRIFKNAIYLQVTQLLTRGQDKEETHRLLHRTKELNFKTKRN